jgi:drug/metabolite transporter (DMT)-like permease
MERKTLLWVLCCYFLVVAIWSTTPLTIKWSGEGAGYLFGITARMLIGTVLALLLQWLLEGGLATGSKAMQVYVAAGMAIFGAMLPVYWGAQFIPSGLISVIFGLTPIMTAWMAANILREQSLSPGKIAGAIIGLCGLLVIFWQQLHVGAYAVWGMLAVLFSVVLHSLSAVLIKRIDAGLSALSVTTGGLLFALPLFVLAYWMSGNAWPDALPARTLGSIIYLGIMGSVVGFVAYYYVLEKLSTATVSLITLMTPPAAVWLGGLLNNEQPGVSVWLGTAMVLSGLVMHQWGGVLKRYLK